MSARKLRQHGKRRAADGGHSTASRRHRHLHRTRFVKIDRPAGRPRSSPTRRRPVRPAGRSPWRPARPVPASSPPASSQPASTGPSSSDQTVQTRTVSCTSSRPMPPSTRRPGSPAARWRWQTIGIDTAEAGSARRAGCAIPIDLAQPISPRSRRARPSLGPYSASLSALRPPRFAREDGAGTVRRRPDPATGLPGQTHQGQTATTPIVADGPPPRQALKDGDIVRLSGPGN